MVDEDRKNKVRRVSMPNDKWGVQDQVKVVVPRKGGCSIGPREEPLKVVVSENDNSFDKAGMYIPWKERRKMRDRK